MQRDRGQERQLELDLTNKSIRVYFYPKILDDPIGIASIDSNLHI